MFDDQKVSFDTAVKAFGTATFAFLGRHLIKVWRSTKKEEFDSHLAVIKELHRINAELYNTISKLQKDHLAAIEAYEARIIKHRELVHKLNNELLVARFEAANRGWNPEENSK